MEQQLTIVSKGGIALTAKEIIILLSKQAGLTQEQVAARLGFDKANHISVPLSRNDGMGMRLEIFIRWLDALDAELVVESINGDGEWVLDGDDEGVTYKS